MIENVCKSNRRRGAATIKKVTRNENTTKKREKPNYSVVFTKPHLRLQSMSRDCPEDDGEDERDDGDESKDPDGSADQELSHIGLPDAQGPKRRGLALVGEEQEEWVQFVRMAHKQQYCDRKGYEQEPTFAFWCDVEEDEGKAGGEPDPEHDETHDESDECRNGCKVSKGLCAQETRVGVLFHRTKDVLLLGVEHVGDLSESGLLEFVFFPSCSRVPLTARAGSHRWRIF